jgi:hypothetical protein
MKKSWGCSSAGRAPRSQRGGQRFDPAQLHQTPSCSAPFPSPIKTEGNLQASRENPAALGRWRVRHNPSPGEFLTPFFLITIKRRSLKAPPLLHYPLPHIVAAHNCCQLLLLLAAMSTARSRAAAAMRGLGVGSGVRCYLAWRGMRCSRPSRHRMGSRRGTVHLACSAAANCRTGACTSYMRATILSTSRRRSAATVIASSAAVHEAMTAPAVAVAPSGPGAHAQEDAIVEISRPVEAAGRARVRRIVVVTPRANRLNANVDHHLCLGCWRQGQAREQCCTTEENLESAHIRPP